LAEHVAKELQQPTPSSGILSAENLHKLREPPELAPAIPSSDDIVPELHDTLPQLALRSKRRWPLLVLGLAAAAGLVLFMALSGEEVAESSTVQPIGVESATPPSPAPADKPETQPADPPAPAAAGVPVVPSLRVEADPPGAPAAPGDRLIEVTILLQLDPADAKVEIDGIATTGPVLHLPKSDHVYRLTVSAPGYKTVERDLRAIVDGEMEISLPKKKKARATRPPSGSVGPMETDL
jgi:hypothetical protein